jgi:hypothetical protein
LEEEALITDITLGRVVQTLLLGLQQQLEAVARVHKIAVLGQLGRLVEVLEAERVPVKPLERVLRGREMPEETSVPTALTMEAEQAGVKGLLEETVLVVQVV